MARPGLGEAGCRAGRATRPFRRASVPGGRSSRFSVRPCRRRAGSDGLHMQRGGGGSPAPGACVTRHLTRSRPAVACQACGACARPPLRRRGTDWRVMHVAGRKTSPRDHRTPQMPAVIRGAPKRSAEDHCATLAGREADGSNGGHLEGVWRAPRGSILRANLHNSTIERICAGLAVLRVPYMRSAAGPRGIGPIVELCTPGAPRPLPGTTAPTLRCPPLSPNAATPPRGNRRPTSGARR